MMKMGTTVDLHCNGVWADCATVNCVAVDLRCGRLCGGNVALDFAAGDYFVVAFAMNCVAVDLRCNGLCSGGVALR